MLLVYVTKHVRTGTAVVIVPDRVLDEFADELRQQGQFSDHPAVRDAAGPAPPPGRRSANQERGATRHRPVSHAAGHEARPAAHAMNRVPTLRLTLCHIPRRRAIRRRVPRLVGIALEPSLHALQSPLSRRGRP